MKRPDNIDLILAAGVLLGATALPCSVLSERIEKVAKWLLEQA